MEQNGLKIFSLGVILENKEPNSDMVKVMPIEQLSLFTGPLDQQKLMFDVNLPDSQGVKKNNKVEGGVEIVAKWIFSGGNRITAPDVINGETVIIYQFADTDEYYWELLFREPSIRRLEHVNYSYSNLPKGRNPYDKTSSYWFEVSTRDKYIQLHTSKNDNELFEYDIKIDTADGNLVIKDDIDNHVTIDSKNSTITIQHSSGHSFIMNPEGITMNSDKFIVNAADVEFNSNSIKLIADSIQLQGGNIELTGSSITANGEDLSTDLQ